MSLPGDNQAAVIKTQPVALELSEQALQAVTHNIALCQRLISEVLERDIDWGSVPGISQPFLFDSGAAKIMSAFNCYAKYSLLEKVDTPIKISFTFFVELISRKTQQVIATGIGAATTRETKHKYRWTFNPEQEGIPRKGLKKRDDGKYRIPNPDIDELVNIIAKMSAKRADIDAVQSLPGVAATLRKLFRHQDIGPYKPNWRRFQAQINTLGVSHEEAQEILNVASIRVNWIGEQHKTLDEAYEIIKAARQPAAPTANPEQKDIFGGSNGDD